MVSSFVACGVVCVGVFIVLLSLIFLDFVVVFTYLFLCLLREKGGLELVRWGGGKDLGGVGTQESMIRIYCMKLTKERFRLVKHASACCHAFFLPTFPPSLSEITCPTHFFPIFYSASKSGKVNECKKDSSRTLHLISPARHYCLSNYDHGPF